MRVAGAGDGHPGRLAALGAQRHQHGLGQGAGSVVHRGVRDLHRRERRDHALVLVDDLQRPLARLRLVRRVGRHELAARGDVPDCRRDVVVVASRAREAGSGLVQPSAVTHLGEHRHLVHGVVEGAEIRRLQRRFDLAEQLVDGVRTDAGEHGALIFGGVRNKRHWVLPEGQ